MQRLSNFALFKPLVNLAASATLHQATGSDIELHLAAAAAAQSSASVAAEVPVVHAAQTASVVVVPAVRRVTAAALATGACLPQVGAECAAQLALMTFGTVFGLVQNPAAHGVQVRSAIAVAAAT